jgi:hypothetical protein
MLQSSKGVSKNRTHWSGMFIVKQCCGKPDSKRDQAKPKLCDRLDCKTMQLREA